MGNCTNWLLTCVRCQDAARCAVRPQYPLLQCCNTPCNCLYKRALNPIVHELDYIAELVSYAHRGGLLRVILRTSAVRNSGLPRMLVECEQLSTGDVSPLLKQRLQTVPGTPMLARARNVASDVKVMYYIGQQFFASFNASLDEDVQ
eukprot:gb/GECG01000304.1/.p1 GENE.gb/GECG01000304.1/~~gb/GECG01000304.1/.p1  ORF type:complete len:147 (+),score=6.53 gb/GECG01000304.1/:1-441(+)